LSPFLYGGIPGDNYTVIKGEFVADIREVEDERQQPYPCDCDERRPAGTGDRRLAWHTLSALLCKFLLISQVHRRGKQGNEIDAIHTVSRQTWKFHHRGHGEHGETRMRKAPPGVLAILLRALRGS
jgi:hypothetical protein